MWIETWERTLVQRAAFPTVVLTVFAGLLAWNAYVHAPVTSEIANLPTGIPEARRPPP